MECLTPHDAEKWAREHGAAEVGGGPARVSSESGLRILTNCTVPRLVSLARVILLSADESADPNAFRGALIWITQTRIWDASTEQLGAELFVRFRSPEGHAADLTLSPATVTTEREFTQAVGLLLLPMAFQWDAWVLPLNKEYAAFVSHDGYVLYSANDPKARNRLKEGLEEGHWSYDTIPPMHMTFPTQ